MKKNWVKKYSARWYIKLLDKEFSALIREKGFCEWCGRKDATLQCSHVIPRTNHTLRWCIFNACCFCGQCHRFKWHEHPLLATAWFKDKFPERYKYLQENQNRVVKRTKEDYEKILKAVREKDFNKLLLDK